MEFFHRAKIVRLRSHHSKYLVADDDEENVRQQSNGASPAAKWTVEFIDGKPNAIRLKSAKTWKYLSAYEDPRLLGWTGKRVVQASPRLRGDASVEWEPVKDGPFVKLRARTGTFLRANGALPPWRNTITHLDRDSSNPEWALWVVDILDIDYTAEGAPPRTGSVSSSYGGGRSGSPVGSVRSEQRPSPKPQESDSLSRSSSTSSNNETPMSPIRLFSCSPTPATSQPTEEVSSSYIPKLANNSSKSSNPSSSFNRLDSVIAEADKFMSDRRNSKKNDPQEDQPPSPDDVLEAKHTLAEAKTLDFESMHSSGRLDSVESAISILLAHESSFEKSRMGNKTKLVNLKNQLEALRAERAKAGEEEEACEEFAGRKAETKAELQREVGRARELQRKDAELVDKVEELRRRREEILREVERVEGEIREREEEQVRNEVVIEEVCGEIGRRSDGVKGMEREEEEWARRKEAAERGLREVEEGWGVLKVSLRQDV